MRLHSLCQLILFICIGHNYLLLKIDRLLLQVFWVGAFVLIQEQQRLALATGAGCPSNAMDELVAPLGRVKLHDPVHVGNVDSSSRQVSRQKHCTGGVSVFAKSEALELVVNLGALFLIDLSVQLLHRVHRAVTVFEEVLEAFLVEVDGSAGAEENHKPLRL